MYQCTTYCRTAKCWRRVQHGSVTFSSSLDSDGGRKKKKKKKPHVHTVFIWYRCKVGLRKFWWSWQSFVNSGQHQRWVIEGGPKGFCPEAHPSHKANVSTSWGQRSISWRRNSTHSADFIIVIITITINIIDFTIILCTGVSEDEGRQKVNRHLSLS